MTGVTFAEKITMPDQTASSQDGRSSNSNRTLYIIVAVVCGILVTAGVVTGGVLLGHKLTRDSYKEARMEYKTEDGKVRQETVRVDKDEVDFNAKNDFSVIYDYKRMLVVIKTTDGSDDICYVTKLNPEEMGAYNDIRQKVEDASSTGGLLQSNDEREIQFVRTNITLDAATLSPKAGALCKNAEIVMLEKQASPTEEEEGAVETRERRRIGWRWEWRWSTCTRYIRVFGRRIRIRYPCRIRVRVTIG